MSRVQCSDILCVTEDRCPALHCVLQQSILREFSQNHIGRMPSRRTVKLILYEVLELTCLCVPVFVVLERFASLMRFMKSNDTTAYWLVIAGSIAYVTTTTLFVWLPLKYFTLKSRRFFTEVTSWRPVTLAYLLLSTLPCFAILLASSKVQVDTGVHFDLFTELPVSLVLFSLILLDIIERIRPFRLRGQADALESDFEVQGPVLTHMEQISSVSAQLQANGVEKGSAVRTEIRSVTPSERWRDLDGSRVSHASSTAYLYASRSYSGSLRVFWVRDPRVEVFLDAFVFWMDTVEMVRVAGLQAVFYSSWIFPIYILAFFSLLRLMVTPHSPMLTLLGVLLQDLPFLVLRLCLTVIFGYVTPLLYVMKNLLVCLSFVYFMFLTNLKVFSSGNMF